LKDLVDDLAQASERSTTQVEGALGVLMGYLLDTVKPATAGKLEEALPDLARLAAPHRSSGGLFGAFAGGAAGLVALPGKLAKQGFDKPRIKQLGPRVMTWLKEHVDPKLWREVEGQLPGFLRR
jgi:hypothetical protein